MGQLHLLDLERGWRPGGWRAKTGPILALEATHEMVCAVDEARRLSCWRHDWLNGPAQRFGTTRAAIIPWPAKDPGVRRDPPPAIPRYPGRPVSKIEIVRLGEDPKPLAVLTATQRRQLVQRLNDRKSYRPATTCPNPTHAFRIYDDSGAVQASVFFGPSCPTMQASPSIPMQLAVGGNIIMPELRAFFRKLCADNGVAACAKEED